MTIKLRPFEQLAILPFYGEVEKAQAVAKRAADNGLIAVSTSCELCGRSGCRINGHHESYFKPLDLIFLCARCHTNRHARLRERDRDPRVVYAMERLAGRPAAVAFRKHHPDALARIRERVRLMEATAEGVA